LPAFSGEIRRGSVSIRDRFRGKVNHTRMLQYPAAPRVFVEFALSSSRRFTRDIIHVALQMIPAVSV